MKPENVILTDDGRVKVADFGLARAASAGTSTSGVLMGTVAYLAPELIAEGVADARADVYAVGVMLFEMLTGRQPFAGDVPLRVAYRHVHEDVPPPSSLVPRPAGAARRARRRRHRARPRPAPRATRGPCSRSSGPARIPASARRGARRAGPARPRARRPTRPAHTQLSTPRRRGAAAGAPAGAVPRPEPGRCRRGPGTRRRPRRSGGRRASPDIDHSTRCSRRSSPGAAGGRGARGPGGAPGGRRRRGCGAVAHGGARGCGRWPRWHALTGRRRRSAGRPCVGPSDLRPSSPRPSTPTPSRRCTSRPARGPARGRCGAAASSCSTCPSVRSSYASPTSPGRDPPKPDAACSAVGLMAGEPPAVCDAAPAAGRADRPRPVAPARGRRSAPHRTARRRSRRRGLPASDERGQAHRSPRAAARDATLRRAGEAAS